MFRTRRLTVLLIGSALFHGHRLLRAPHDMLHPPQEAAHSGHVASIAVKVNKHDARKISFTTTRNATGRAEMQHRQPAHTTRHPIHPTAHHPTAPLPRARMPCPPPPPVARGNAANARKRQKPQTPQNCRWSGFLCPGVLKKSCFLLVASWNFLIKLRLLVTVLCSSAIFSTSFKFDWKATNPLMFCLNAGRISIYDCDIRIQLHN